MIQKRPFVEEDCYNVAYKHPKRWEESNHYTPMGNGIPCNSSYHSHQTSGGEDLQNFSKCQNEWRNESKLEITDGTNNESEASTSCTMPHLFWANDGVTEPDFKDEAPFHLPFFPDFFLTGIPLKALFQSENIYSSLLDSPSWKAVSVGPEHQADVPEWGLQHSGIANDCDAEKLMGTRVIPMPFSNCSESEGARIECRCLDSGSVRCVKQHVMEAREKLMHNLGSEIFEELGLCGMGENVAKTWSMEEEKAFQHLVLSNPASSGNIFWEHLSLDFPSRMKKDLVSYYFNVYMLRKRADQNRFDPEHIDSDNDEWQRNEDDEGSVVNSLVAPKTLACNSESYALNCLAKIENDYEICADCHVKIEDDDENCADVVHGVATEEEDERSADNILEAEVGIPQVIDSGFQLSTLICENNARYYGHVDEGILSWLWANRKTLHRVIRKPDNGGDCDFQGLRPCSWENGHRKKPLAVINTVTGECAYLLYFAD